MRGAWDIGKMRKIKMSRKAVNFGIAALVIAIVILGAVGWFYFIYSKDERKPEIPAAEISQPARRFGIVDMRLCDSIDENFNCKENLNAEFNTISFIDILIKVDGLKAKEENGGYKIAYAESREIIGPGNEVIEPQNVVIDKEDTVPNEGSYSVNLKDNIIIFENARLGNYLLKIIITDKNTGNIVTENEGFKIK